MNISQLQSIIDKNSNAICFAEINIKSLKEFHHRFPEGIAEVGIKQYKWIISRLAKEQRKLKCEIKGMIENKRGYIKVDGKLKRCKHKDLSSATSYVHGGASTTTYCADCRAVAFPAV